MKKYLALLLAGAMALSAAPLNVFASPTGVTGAVSITGGVIDAPQHTGFFGAGAIRGYNQFNERRWYNRSLEGVELNPTSAAFGNHFLHQDVRHLQQARNLQVTIPQAWYEFEGNFPLLDGNTWSPDGSSTPMWDRVIFPELELTLSNASWLTQPLNAVQAVGGDPTTYRYRVGGTDANPVYVWGLRRASNNGLTGRADGLTPTNAGERPPAILGEGFRFYAGVNQNPPSAWGNNDLGQWRTTATGALVYRHASYGDQWVLFFLGNLYNTSRATLRIVDQSIWRNVESTHRNGRVFDGFLEEIAPLYEGVVPVNNGTTTGSSPAGTTTGGSPAGTTTEGSPAGTTAEGSPAGTTTASSPAGTTTASSPAGTTEPGTVTTSPPNGGSLLEEAREAVRVAREALRVANLPGATAAQETAAARAGVGARKVAEEIYSKISGVEVTSENRQQLSNLFAAGLEAARVAVEAAVFGTAVEFGEATGVLRMFELLGEELDFTGSDFREHTHNRGILQQIPLIVRTTSGTNDATLSITQAGPQWSFASLTNAVIARASDDYRATVWIVGNVNNNIDRHTLTFDAVVRENAIGLFPRTWYMDIIAPNGFHFLPGLMNGTWRAGYRPGRADVSAHQNLPWFEVRYARYRAEPNMLNAGSPGYVPQRHPDRPHAAAIVLGPNRNVTRVQFDNLRPGPSFRAELLLQGLTVRADDAARPGRTDVYLTFRDAQARSATRGSGLGTTGNIIPDGWGEAGNVDGWLDVYQDVETVVGGTVRFPAQRDPVIGNQLLRVGTIADWNFTIETLSDEIPELPTGRLYETGMGHALEYYHMTARFRVSETVRDTFHEQRGIVLTLPYGVRIREANFVAVRGTSNAMRDRIQDYRHFNLGARDHIESGFDNVLVDDNEIVIRDIPRNDGNNNGRFEFDIELFLSIVPGFENELEDYDGQVIDVRLGGRALREGEAVDTYAVIATAVDPIRVEADLTNIRVGLQFVPIGDFAIIENFAGALMDNDGYRGPGMVYITITDRHFTEMQFRDVFSWEVSEGNVDITTPRINNTLAVGGVWQQGGNFIEFEVRGRSTVASTIQFTNVEVRVAPHASISTEGYDVVVFGSGVTQNTLMSRRVSELVNVGNNQNNNILTGAHNSAAGLNLANLRADFVRGAGGTGASSGFLERINPRDLFDVVGFYAHYLMIGDRGQELTSEVIVIRPDGTVSIGDETRSFDPERYGIAHVNANGVGVAPLRLAMAMIFDVNPSNNDLISFSESTATAYIDPQGLNLRFTNGDSVMRVDGVPRSIMSGEGANAFPYAAYIDPTNSRMMIPLRALGEAVGFTVTFDAGTITLTPPGAN